MRVLESYYNATTRDCRLLQTISTDSFRSPLHVQLKQGRPVQREAVLAGGAGDYSSMMYGDKEAPPVPTPGPGTNSGIIVGSVVIGEPIVALAEKKVEKEVEKGKAATAEVQVALASLSVSATPVGTYARTTILYIYVDF